LGLLAQVQQCKNKATWVQGQLWSRRHFNCCFAERNLSQHTLLGICSPQLGVPAFHFLN